jgi:hypothetical protein
MADNDASRAARGAPDPRHLLVNELWQSIRTIVEESDFDPAWKDELMLDLGKCDARRDTTGVVSLRALPTAGETDRDALDQSLRS